MHDTGSDPLVAFPARVLTWLYPVAGSGNRARWDRALLGNASCALRLGSGGGDLTAQSAVKAHRVSLSTCGFRWSDPALHDLEAVSGDIAEVPQSHGGTFG